MREILFRGKKTGTNEWVEGFVSSPFKDTMCTFVEHNTQEAVTWYVDDCTVGQYTGLTDKNGNKIFEGDIGKDRGGNIHVVRYGRFTPKNFYRMFGYDTTISIYGLHTVCDEVECMLPTNHTLEIIGNIHDNPELLKGGAE